jgi:ABC-type nitrate/sulfonate/bicarbonate transport system permease component
MAQVGAFRRAVVSLSAQQRASTLANNWTLGLNNFGTPSGIALYLWDGFVIGRKLWLELGYTVTGTLVSFVLGSVSALLLGLVFVMSPKVERAMDPYLMVVNAMPRFALALLALLSMLGMAVTCAMTRLEKTLLKWQ